jgi:hypothetical protein
MKSRVGPLLRLGAILVAAAALVVACSSSKPTELVPGVMTQLQLPRDLQAIRIDLRANGALVFCRSYQATTGGIVTLPSTLGVVSQSSPNTTVTITVGGYDAAGASGNLINNCSVEPRVDPTSPDAPRVVRVSVQTYVAGHTLFIPMPISFSCFDQDCSSMNASGVTYSCKGGQCVLDPDPAAAAKKLVDFTPTLIDGTAGQCFSPKACFPSNVPPVLFTAVHAHPATPEDCIYALPPGAPAGTGLNVRVFYEEQEWALDARTGDFEHSVIDGGEEEILDEDPVEGFTSLGNGQFQLAPGLCALANHAFDPPPPPASGTLRYITITDVQASALCSPKVQLLPLCAAERYTSPNLPDGGSSSNGLCNVAIPLLQTPSAIYLVMDDSEVMSSAFGEHGSATAMSLSLSDPVFLRTSAAFKFLTHNDAECPPQPTTSYSTPTIPFDLAPTAQAQIANALKNWVAPDMGQATPANLDLLAATQPIGAYAAVQSFFSHREAPDIAAVMFFVNRVPGGTAANPANNDCVSLSPTTELENDAAQAFAATPSMQTFFVVLGSAPSDPDVLAFYQQLETDHPDFITTIDATSSQPDTVVANFAHVVTRLGTCLYELPEGTTPTTPLTVQYVDPFSMATTAVPKNTNCSAATQGTADGWNIDGTRLRICGVACTGLRDTIVAASATAAAAMPPLPAPNVPVTTTLPCPAPSDAGLGGD